MPRLTVYGGIPGCVAIIWEKSAPNSLEIYPIQQRIHIEGQACIPLQCALKCVFRMPHAVAILLGMKKRM